ncbi:MAG: potassium transporter Trk, partial [Myxococcales bacterium]|nr:potassium transporter Trk [Myxococcales bacterium]
VQLSTMPSGPARRWVPRGLDRALDAMLLDPAVTVLATFLGGGLLGTALLALPLATEGGGSLDLIDAAFTAFSAVCVTGLGVVDTPNTFGAFGEATLLVLIQVGGLGIMTLSTAALTFLGRRLSVRHEVTAAQLLQAEDRRTMANVLRRILLVTGIFEGAGAALLTVLFWAGGDTLGQALWRGVFTAISAFCNAGFALQSDSLVGYQTAPLVLLTIGLLIVVGGLGPVVIAACWARGRHGKRLSVAARVVLWTSLALTLIGFAGFLSFEWRGTLGHLGPVDRVVNALFQSITLRTAGFNSIDLAASHPATLAIMLPLMFVGGSPASTAGGIKTTTIAVLLFLLRASFGNAERVQLMGRTLRPETTHKAAAVAFLGFGSVFGTLLMLLATQAMSFHVALFEAVSALGTVGLTIGGTGALDLVGKVIVIVAMFAGRVGPLTLLIVIGRHGRVGAGPELPPIEVDVG